MDLRLWGGYLEISYYAIFDYSECDGNAEKYSISITFPDIPEANTCARNDIEGLAMALEVLQLSLIENDGSWPSQGNLPKATPLEQIKLGQHERAVLIRFETEDVDLSKFHFFT
ncbi:hypothetical protein [Intestinimonas butyriciproducens]|uniref:hypothetical protein n=1 Tax=Intestinimonas butyriciproducens TaxID=1297617 RepID=UPI0019572D48|nr:hypothetical protein [Intestinimonas butyriciproducens]MBM6974971.1 hypothetical protein [Intestinimonas butyriciproducens]